MIEASELSAVDRRTKPAGHRAFFCACVLVFVASVATTIQLCRSMSQGMAMPGGWTLSMTWIRMQGQSWPDAAASFMEMWIVMMVAMMLPALVPTLVRYRVSLRGLETTYVHALTVIAGAGYFLVWALAGAIVYPIGAVVANGAMSSAALSRWVPIAGGVALVVVGVVQLTPWKARQLCRFRQMPLLDQDLRRATQYGIRLGADCVLCCSGLMLTLLVAGVMNLGVMLLVTIAIIAERLVPKREWAVRATALVIIATGVFVAGGAMGAAFLS